MVASRPGSMSREQSSGRRVPATINTSTPRSMSQDEADSLTTLSPMSAAASSAAAPGGVGVLFCGTMDKRHPYTGQVYPRFVVLTASALHWFKRPRYSELFGEPRGTLWLSWLRRTTISGPERRELCLEFDSPTGLGGGNNGGAQQQQQQRDSLRAVSTDSMRGGVNSKYERFLGSKRNFIAPTAAAAIAWKAAIELAVRECDDSTKFAPSLSNANPSSLSDYFTHEVTQDMEDGYGDANFLEALGRLVEEDDAYALGPPPSGNSPGLASPGIRRGRIVKAESMRSSSDTASTAKFVSVVSYAGTILARNVSFGSSSSQGAEIEISCARDDEPSRKEAFGKDEGLVATLCDGSSAHFTRTDIWQTTGLVSAEVVSPLRQQDSSCQPRRTLTVKVDRHAVDASILSDAKKLRAAGLVVLLVLPFLVSVAVFLFVVLFFTIAASLSLDGGLVAPASKRCRIEIVEERIETKSERISSLRRSGSISFDEESAPGTTTAAKSMDPKFLAAAKGDRQEASRRLSASLSWRRSFRVDEVLTERQPFFSVIKDAYPHWLGGRTRKNELIYWERVGFVDVEKLRVRGVTVDSLIRHYIFANEWTWKVLSPAPDGPESCQIVVLDVTGVKLSHVGGLRLEYLRECAKIAQLSYPERTSAYVVINAPAWISIAWRVVEPILNQETRKRVHICRVGKQTTDKLLELVHPDHVPTCYGGSFGDPNMTIDEARRRTPEELAFTEYVNKLNSRPTSPPPPPPRES